MASALAGFTNVFGACHADSIERHEGLVAVTGFELRVKLFAFMVMGLFVCIELVASPAALFDQAQPFAHAQWLGLTQAGHAVGHFFAAPFPGGDG